MRISSSISQLINKTWMSTLKKLSLAKLQNRAMLQIKGPQLQKFLQGMITNNIHQLSHNNPQQKQHKLAIYSLFLSSKGKIITDAIIIKPQIYEKGIKKFIKDQLWIQIDKQMSVGLCDHIRKYTWKKQITITNLQYSNNNPAIHVLYINNKNKSNQLLKKLQQMNMIPGYQAEISIGIEDIQLLNCYSNSFFVDPRGIMYGIRIIYNTDFYFKEQFFESNSEQYYKNCMLNGISSSSVMSHKFPFMFNSDFLHGFSFKKGCYLGQQIIARSYFTGVVRKRIFPFILEDTKKILDVGINLYDQSKMEIGKVFQSREGYGTVLCNYLPFLDKLWPIKIKQPVKGYVNTPFQKDLRQYVKQTQAKQQKLKEIDL